MSRPKIPPSLFLSILGRRPTPSDTVANRSLSGDVRHAGGWALPARSSTREILAQIDHSAGRQSGSLNWRRAEAKNLHLSGATEHR